MSDKVLNTRIRLKYDTWDNWNTTAGKAVVLLKGEIGFCAIPSNGTTQTHAGDGNSAPQVLFKVGDGSTTFVNLPWVSALSADIFGWAKQENHFEYRLYTDTSHAGSFVLQICENPDATDPVWTNVGDWFSAGGTPTAADVSILIGGTAVSPTIKVQISNATDNLLELKSSTNPGLYVPAPTISASEQSSTSDEITVVTGVSIDTTNKNQFNATTDKVYSKTKIDNLINPAMEFKGVVNDINSAAGGTGIHLFSLTNVKKGDSYKLTDDTTYDTITYYAGTVFIAVKDNPAQTIDDLGEDDQYTGWASIQTASQDTDTWRPIQLNGAEKQGTALSTGALNLKSGTGITIDYANSAFTFGVDLSALAVFTSTAKGLVPAGGAITEGSNVRRVLLNDATWSDDDLIIDCGSATTLIS